MAFRVLKINVGEYADGRRIKSYGEAQRSFGNFRRGLVCTPEPFPDNLTETINNGSSLVPNKPAEIFRSFVQTANCTVEFSLALARPASRSKRKIGQTCRRAGQQAKMMASPNSILARLTVTFTYFTFHDERMNGR